MGLYHQNERPRLEDLIRNTERKLLRLADLSSEGDLDKETYHSRRDATGRELEDARRALADLAKYDAVAEAEAADARLLELAGFEASWPAEMKRDWLDRYVPEIRITRHGVDRIVLRFPLPDGQVTERTMGYEDNQLFSWADLGVQPEQPGDRTRKGIERAHAKGIYYAADVADALGVTPGYLRVLIKRGKVPEPSGDRDRGSKRTWTAEQVASMAAQGLPPKRRAG